MSEGFKKSDANYSVNVGDRFNSVLPNSQKYEALSTTNLSNNTTVEEIDLDEKPVETKGFNNTTDQDDININNYVTHLTNSARVYLKNNKKLYKIYCEYISGKNMKDIFSPDSKIDEKKFEELTKDLTPKEKQKLRSVIDPNRFWKSNIITEIKTHIKDIIDVIYVNKENYTIEAQFLVDYIENMKDFDVNKLLNKDGTLNISLDDKEIQKMMKEKSISADRLKKLIKEIKYNITPNDKMLDCNIQEVVNSESGYDAIVFEKDGEYWIENSCCDGQQMEDLQTIGYSLVYQLIGNDDFYNEYADVFASSIKDSGLPLSPKDIKTAAKIYNQQRKDCYKLIEKYQKEGKIRLGGYSLGGGLMLDAYMKYAMNNPEKAKDIKLDLYNPYIGLIESNDDWSTANSDDYNNYLNEKIKNSKSAWDRIGVMHINSKENRISYILDRFGQNIDIYCTSGDVVSQFNTVTDDLKEVIKYLKPNEDIDYSLKGLNVLDLIGNDVSRHSLNGYDTHCFNKDGNITEYGEQTTLSEIVDGASSFVEIMPWLPFSPAKTNNLNIVFSKLLTGKLKRSKEFIKEEDLSKFGINKDDVTEMYDSACNYLTSHIGSLNIDDLIDNVSPSLYKVVKSAAAKQNWFANITNIFLSEDKLKNNFITLIHSENGKKIIKDIIATIQDDPNNIGNIMGKYSDEIQQLYMDSLSVSAEEWL